jgi:sterol desaturase/sphingolipid hydroxylase (fatty acid hydroxylase superfamily)
MFTHYVCYPFLVHFFSYWSISSIFYLIDYFRLESTHPNWNRYKLAATVSLKNQFCVGLPTLYLLSGKIQNAVELSSNDGVLFMIWKLFLIVNASNLLFYWSHRALHIPFMFKYIHYKHHEFTEPIGVAALYAHPVEHLLANTLSFLVPFMYIGTNYYIMLGLLGFSSAVTVFYHTKSFNIFNDHLIHHQLYKYNYGFGGYLDKVFGTYK